MKKILSAIMATALVASMSVTSFAAVDDVVNGDGVTVSGSTISADLAAGTISGDPVLPNTSFYVALGNGTANADIAGDLKKPVGTTAITVEELTNKDYWKFSVDKDENSKLIKGISVVTDRKLGSLARTAYLKIDVADTTATSETKTTGTIEFKAKHAKTSGNKPGQTAGGGGTTSVWAKDDVISFNYTLWVSNKTSSDSADAGDRVVMNPASNEENEFIWGDDRAALQFDATDDAKKFYARLSTSNINNIYTEYGDPANADLWFYDFVGNPTVPSTSRATLTLGIPWDESADYVPNPANVYIYEVDADGYLNDVTDLFTYSEDATAINGWSIKTRTLGTYVISDTELDVTVADESAVEEKPAEEVSSAAPATPDKGIPNTGSSDMVNVAVVAGIVSLAAAGAVAFRKAK